MLNILISKIKKDVHLRDLISGSSVAFVIRISGAFLGYCFALLITRNYGAYAMGIFAMSTTVLSMSTIFSRFGLDTALLRFVAEYIAQGKMHLVDEVYHKVLLLAIPISISLTCFLLIFSPYIAQHVFQKEYLSHYFRIASLGILPLTLMFINSQGLRALKKIREFTFFQFVSNFLFASLFLAISIQFTKMESLPLITYILAIIFSALLSQALWRKRSNLRRTQNVKSIRINQILNVSLPMLFSGSMLLIISWIGTLMLGAIRSEAEVGIFNVAVRVAAITSIMLIAVNSIAAPKFAEFYSKGDMVGLESIVNQSTKLIFWLSFPILVVILLFPSFLLGIFGEEFKGGNTALLVLAGGQFINAISGSVGVLLNMTGRQKVFRNIVFVSVVINIFLNTMLIPRYGIMGAAFAEMSAMAIWNLSAVAYIKKDLNISTVYLPVFSGKRF